MKMKMKGFTLLELLIVIAILAVLATVVILVMNPAESIKRARDAQRVSDMDNLKSAVILYMIEGNVNIKAVECPTGAPCSSSGGVTKVDGTGWIPINFTTMGGGSPLTHLPIDPVNSGTYLYYYAASGTDFELNSVMESHYYSTANPIMTKDGGDSTTRYEVGTRLDIIVGP